MILSTASWTNLGVAIPIHSFIPPSNKYFLNDSKYCPRPCTLWTHFFSSWRLYPSYVSRKTNRSYFQRWFILWQNKIKTIKGNSVHLGWGKVRGKHNLWKGLSEGLADKMTSLSESWSKGSIEPREQLADENCRQMAEQSKIPEAGAHLVHGRNIKGTYQWGWKGINEGNRVICVQVWLQKDNWVTRVG